MTVTSVFGRTGAVTAQAGDYSASQVGALPVGGGTITGSLSVDGDELFPTSAFSNTTGGFVGGAIRSGIGHIIENTFVESVGPVITTVAAGSNGGQVADIATWTSPSAGVLDANPCGAPTSGQLSVNTTPVTITAATNVGSTITLHASLAAAVGESISISGASGGTWNTIDGTWTITATGSGTLTIVVNVAPTGTYSTNSATFTQSALISYSGLVAGTSFTGCAYVSGSSAGTVSTGSTIQTVAPDPLFGTPLLIQYNPTIDYNGGILGPATNTGVMTALGVGFPRARVNLEGTLTAKTDINSIQGVGLAFQHMMNYKNDPTTAVDIGVSAGFVNVPVVVADTQSISMDNSGGVLAPTGGGAWELGFVDQPLFGTINGGSLSNVEMCNFYAGGQLLPGVAGTTRVGYLASDIAVSGTATLTSQYGIIIGTFAEDGVTLSPLVGATNNIGFYNLNSTWLDNDVIIRHANATYTAEPDSLIQIAPETYTYDYAGVVIPSGFAYGGTHVLQYSANSFVMGVGVNFNPVFKNLPTVAANLGNYLAVSVGPSFVADTESITGGQWTMYYAAPNTSVLNGGALASGVSIINFSSSGSIGSGSTVASLTGVLVANPGGSGTLTLNIGVDIASQTKATTNIGLRNAAPTVYTPSGTQAVSAGFTITANATHVALSSTGPVSASTTGPTIPVPNSASTGQEITVINTNTTVANTMTFTSGTTEKMSLGAATRVVGAGGSLTLIYNATFGRWIEIAFNPGGN